jgi:hypothetical protein
MENKKVYIIILSNMSVNVVLLQVNEGRNKGAVQKHQIAYL